MTARPMDLRRLLQPRSIALTGASAERASLGGAVLHNIQTFGFPGPLHLVSPTRKEINGAPCLPSLRDLPAGVDVAVLNVPRAAVREAVAACVEREVGAAVVFAAGFAEADAAGREEQQDIAALCRAGGLALLGPNCLGLVNYARATPLTFESLEPAPAGAGPGVAIVAQSGAMGANIRAALTARAIPVSHVVTTGNEAVLRIDHFIAHFVREGVTAIALYVEQIRDPAAFLDAARAAREAGVSITMVHPGSSARGRAAAQSHTGAMTGDYALMRAAVESEGVLLVDGMDELFDAAAMLHRFPKPVSGGVGIITNSGAIRGLSLDFCETVGARVAELSDADKSALRALASNLIEIDNPLDIGPAGYSDASVFAKTTNAMLDNPGVGAVLLALTGGGPWQQRAKAEAVAPAAQAAEKPVALAIVGDESPMDSGAVAILRDSATPLFRSPERALRAFAAMQKRADAYARIEARAALAAAPAPPRRGVLTEYQGKAFLRSIGLATPKGALVQTLEHARAESERLEYPVVLKAQAAALTHKSDVGGVIAGIENDAQLQAAWTRLMDNVRPALRSDALEGVLVEKMAPPGLELLLGGRNDAQWGSFVSIGLGGVWVEALDAIEVLPAHAGREEILARLARMRGAKLLGPFRGAARRDVEALADSILKLGAALRSRPEIREVDINPLRVFAEGEGVEALDALFIVD